MAEQEAVQQNIIEIEATTPAEKVPFEIELPEDANGRVTAGFKFPVGASLAEDVEMYGEETVRDLWLRQCVVKAQSAIRRELENGTHPQDMQEALSGWRPDIQHTSAKDPKASIKSNFAKLGKEEQEALLAMLMEQAGG
jgi:hypothetical protein